MGSRQSRFYGDLGEIASIMHKIWTRRNEFLYEEIFDGSRKVVQRAKDNLEDFQSAQEMMMASR